MMIKNWIKKWSPPWLILIIRKMVDLDYTILNLVRRMQRWVSLLLAGKPSTGEVSVFYGHDIIPSTGDYVSGGLVKFQRMQAIFPNSNRKFNILYMVSSSRPNDWRALTRLAKIKSAKVVWNQDGVAYPAWCKGDCHLINKPMRFMMNEADYVFYQSKFAKSSADLFLGHCKNKWDILYNSVDTSVFTPAARLPEPGRLVLILGGNQLEKYRLELALCTLSEVVKLNRSARLMVTGSLTWTDEQEAFRTTNELIRDLGVADHVEFIGKYTQKEAPEILRKGHILLHTQYNDVCPGLVIEAMACGLPVVYLTSGGVEELVGDEAGAGVYSPTSWDEVCLPQPNEMAQAVIKITENYHQYREAARNRAVEHFDIRPWLQRHQEVFEWLL